MPAARIIGMVLVALTAGCTTAVSTARPGSTPPVEPTEKKKCAGPDEQAAPLPPFTASETEALSKELAASLLAGPWLPQFVAERGRKPALRFYPIRDRTSQLVQTKAFQKIIERELTASQKVTLVATADEAADIREQRRPEQQGKETGADAILSGLIVGMTESSGPTSTLSQYTLTLELVSVETQRKLWIDQASVKRIEEFAPPCPPQGK